MVGLLEIEISEICFLLCLYSKRNWYPILICTILNR